MFEQFRKRLQIDDDKWDEYVSCFHRMEVPAKTVLLNEGEVSKKMFLIEKGCIRVWFNNNIPYSPQLKCVVATLTK